MKLNRRTIFEAILILIIIAQAIAIYCLIDLRNTKVFSNLVSLMNEMSCVDTLSPLMDFEEEGDYDSIIDLGEYLLENGYDGDKLVHQMLARAYYSKGLKIKAAEMLEAAIKGKYLCEIIKPSSEHSIYLDEATAHYQLSEVYAEIGLIEKSVQETERSIELAKIAFGKRYNERVFERIAKIASLKKLGKERNNKDTNPRDQFLKGD